jgi:RNA polymerase sigma-70 factor (ECF subfamily)
VSDPNRTPDLAAGLAAGDPAAQAAVFRRYVDRLAHLAEGRLHRRLAGRVDPEDVAQSAFRTFFRRAADGQFRIDSSAQLWGLLARITLREARGEARRHLADKRDAAAEAGDAPLAGAAARDPDPADAAELVDEIAGLLRGLPDAYGDILGRRLQGESVADVAAALGVSRQTVYRALDLLADRAARRAGADIFPESV